MPRCRLRTLVLPALFLHFVPAAVSRSSGSGWCISILRIGPFVSATEISPCGGLLSIPSAPHAQMPPLSIILVSSPLGTIRKQFFSPRVMRPLQAMLGRHVPRYVAEKLCSHRGTRGSPGTRSISSRSMKMRELRLIPAAGCEQRHMSLMLLSSCSAPGDQPAIEIFGMRRYLFFLVTPAGGGARARPYFFRFFDCAELRRSKSSLFTRRFAFPATERVAKRASAQCPREIVH